MINTLFPAQFGYTDNNVTGNGQPKLRATGDLDLLHATIKTLQSASVDVANGAASAIQVGGDVMVLGPGGSINLGTTAAEINPKLSNSSVGVLTLDNGAIDVFTDANVLVNQSRILTVQGGDILMWSRRTAIWMRAAARRPRWISSLYPSISIRWTCRPSI